LADFYANKAVHFQARRADYSTLLAAAHDLIAWHESMTWRKVTRTHPDEPANADELESQRLSGRMNAALKQLHLTARADTYEAAAAYIDKVMSIVEQGHDVLPVGHPLKQERHDARMEFVARARRDLDIAPYRLDIYRLSWFEYQLAKVPRFRERMLERAWEDEQEAPGRS